MGLLSEREEAQHLDRRRRDGPGLVEIVVPGRRDETDGVGARIGKDLGER